MLVTSVNPAKKDEPIEMRFGQWTLGAKEPCDEAVITLGTKAA